MFSKIWNYLVNVEKTVEHDVEAIISTFTDTVTKLEAAAEAKLAEAVDLSRQAYELEGAAQVAHDASDKARAVAGKIKDLVA
jgi:hypothetical protein